MLADPKPFDQGAQARIAVLFRSCPPEQFLTTLDGYEPRSRAQHHSYQTYRGWALYDAGEYVRSRHHLLRALRSSESGSNGRSLVRGLLAESYLRIGEFDRAERTTWQALSEGCTSDPLNFLQAGHLHAMGRMHACRGHLTHAISTFGRALALLDERSPHWMPILSGVAHAHVRRNELKEAERAIQEGHRGRSGVRAQGWCVASIECQVALEQGDFDRAEDVVRGVTQTFLPRSGERVKLLLTEMQAEVHLARSRPQHAESLLRAVLARAVVGGRNSDAVASATCVLARSLMMQERFDEALVALREGARAGFLNDWGDWVTALRLRAECLRARGATEEAHRASREAMSAHACSEYIGEHMRMERTLGHRVAPAGGRRHRTPTNSAVERFSMPSGRTFVSSDTSLMDAIRGAAATSLPVLIEGETGTGKELVAGLIHDLGARSGSPLTIVDCTVLSEELAHAELFGAARGAYTGAYHERAGLVAQAHQGTMLLDELPDLSPSLQAKLLRVIQDGTYRRLGEDRLRRADVRFIVTTNQPVARLLRRRILRRDLYYRLCGHRINLRPLDSRREDIAPIALEFATQAGLGGIARGAISLLESRPWRGNIRELEMAIRLASTRCHAGSILEPRHLESCLDSTDSLPLHPRRHADLHSSRLAAERSTLRRALAESGGVASVAARALGISRQSLYKALRRAGLR